MRFAVSPLEDLNLSSLRLAIFNYIISKQTKEDLSIRIDDIDAGSNSQAKAKETLELLSLFSIDYTSVVYQSENLKYHQKVAMQLMMKKKAFSCFCSDDKIKQLKKEAKKAKIPYTYDGFCGTLSEETAFNCNAPFVVRLRVPQNEIEFIDLIRGSLKAESSDLDSSIILNHDKNPLSSYACAVDDMLYNISSVIRDEVHLLSTYEQIHLRSSLGYDKKINYAHIAPILKKKSKKKDETSVISLIKQGFMPSAIANYVVLLGNTAPSEVFTLEEAISWFDLKSVSKDSVEFDIKKLEEINKKHLKSLDELRLSKLLGFADEDIGKLAKLYLEELSTLNEMKAKLDAIFSKKSSLKGFEKEYESLFTCLQKAPFIEKFDDFKKYVLKETSLNKDILEKVLRYALTGETKGVDLVKIYPLIKNYLGEIIK